MKHKISKTEAFYLCAIIFYALAAHYLFDGATRSMGIMWLCLGSTFLCLAASLKKNKNKEDKENGKDENSDSDES